MNLPHETHPTRENLEARIRELTSQNAQLTELNQGQFLQLEYLRPIFDAAKALSDEAEEYDFADGLGQGALQQYWDALNDALEPKTEAIEKEMNQHTASLAAETRIEVVDPRKVKPSDRLIVSFPDNGSDWDRKMLVASGLGKGDVVTVQDVYVGSWSSTFTLVGHGGNRFNSVFFSAYNDGQGHTVFQQENEKVLAALALRNGETPRTDAFLENEVNSIDNDYLAFMRQLERELSVANARIAELEALVASYQLK